MKVSDTAHITQPISNNYAGDYIGITAYGGNAWAAWMDNRNSTTWQIYVSKVATHAAAPTLSVNTYYNDWYCSYMSGDYYVNSYPNAVSYTWSTTNGLMINGATSPYTTTSTSVTISNKGDNNANGQVSVIVNLACGTSYPASLYFNGQPDFTPTFQVICPSGISYVVDSSASPEVHAGPLTVFYYSAPSNIRISAYRWYLDGSSSYTQTPTRNLIYPTTVKETLMFL